MCPSRQDLKILDWDVKPQYKQKLLYAVIYRSWIIYQDLPRNPHKTFVHRAFGKVQVGKDQEKAQSEKDSHSKNRDGEKTNLTIRYLYHENIS